MRLRAVLLAALLAIAGCGGGGSDKPDLTVSAAASLQNALTAYARQFAVVPVRYSFAGSDQLAAQIREGIRPDVFASANTKLPQALFAAGLVQRPTAFAANKLVIAVPAGSSKVKSLADLEKRGVTIAIGTASVPVGDYTRTVLARLPHADAAKVMANVRSEEPDVSGIVGKLTQRAVDAGFLYVTDVKAAGGRLSAVDVPPTLEPRVAYGVAIVKGTKHEAQAAAFVAGLLSGAGARALRAAGFLPPP